MKGLSYCASWSLSEVAVFIQTVSGHEHDIYVHEAKIVTLCRALANNPNSGFISRQSSRWRSVCAQVCRVKHHLKKSQLVTDPLDSNDLVYHIPRLEDGHKTSYHFHKLLKTTGYAGFKHSPFRTNFWNCTCLSYVTEMPGKIFTGKLR